MASVEVLVPGALDHPFPGLRPFEAPESFLFFGRDAHTEELLRLLATKRILAVVGTSGSGKSSLVRAGLIPHLHRGHLAGAGSRWRIAVMRPGDSPLDRLAEALAESDGSGRTDPAAVRETLGESSLGLLSAVREQELRPDENLLLLVDQFEELFRYRAQGGGGDDAALFVQSLLAATDQLGVPVFVLITMRSDFLGLCDRFRGLPETLTHSQYLIPRLTRDQLREAIHGPLRIAEVQIAPDLLERVLNDVGDDRDQLPVLQHALMRTFARWKATGEARPIRFEDYRDAGGLEHALDQHAQQLLERLPTDAHRRAAERVFRALTTQETGRAVRRPQSLQELFPVTGAATPAARAVVLDVVETFAARDNSLLLVTRSSPDEPPSVVDITHESLIRKWRSLGAWLRDETRSVEYYTYASRDAALQREGKAAPWRPPALDAALEYLAQGEWNEAWAAQCPDARSSFADTTAFLRMSRDVEDAFVAREEERRRKELEAARRIAASEARAKRLFRGVAALLALVLVGTLVSAWVIYQKQAEIRAKEEQIKVTEQQRVEAEAKVSSLAKAKDEVDRKIAEQLAELNRRGAQGGASTDVQLRLDALVKEKAQYESQLSSARLQARQSTEANTEATRLIADLQAQLSKAREERDAALKRPSNIQGGTAAEAELLRRATTAETRARDLQEQLSAARGLRPPPGEPTGVRKNLEWNQAYEEGRMALEQGRLPEAVYYLRRAVEGARSDTKDMPYLNRTIPYYLPNYYLALAYLQHGSLEDACRFAIAAESAKALQKEDWWRTSVATVRRASCDARPAPKSD